MGGNRYVSAIENSVADLGLNFMVYFETENSLKKADFILAFYFTSLKYPYLRIRIIKDSDNRLKFAEICPFQVSNIELNWINEENSTEFHSWQKRLNMFTCVNYDVSKCVYYTELYEFESTKYRLYFGINHAGCDTRGVTSILKDLFHNLDLILSGKEISSVTSKPFLDIHNNFEHSFNIDELKSEKPRDCQFQVYLNKLDRHETNEENLSAVKTPYYCIFKELDEAESRSLFENCKLNATTVQGVLSIAKAIWIINEKLDLSKATDPIEYENMVVMDMRYYFGLSSEDVFKGASTITWPEVFDLNENLWKSAAKTSEMIKKLKNDNQGLKTWVKTNNSIRLDLARVLSLTVGIVSLNENSLTNVKINDLRFKLSIDSKFYDPIVNSYNLDNYANMISFTFRNRLLMSFHFSFPALSLDWGELYASNFCNILKCFCANSGELTLKEVISNLKRFDDSK